MQSQTPALDFTLGAGSFGSPNIAGEIEVLPGQPQSVAVALDGSGHQGVAIFDDGSQRPNKTSQIPPNNVNEFEPSASTLFALNTVNTEFGFRRLAIDANGVSVAASLQSGLAGNEADMKFDNGLIFGTNGKVFDPQTLSLVGSFVLPGFGYAVAPDSANNRVYFVTESPTDIAPKVWAYDLQTFLQVGTVSIPGLSGWPHELIRCGAGGLALRTGQQPGVLDSTFLNTTHRPNCIALANDWTELSNQIATAHKRSDFRSGHAESLRKHTGQCARIREQSRADKPNNRNRESASTHRQ